MALLKDKDGKTEPEFLRDYDVTKYFRPSVTVDAVLFHVQKIGGLKLLMIKRGGHPYLGMYAFPGGFVDQNESCEAAVSRELAEETGISGVNLRQLVTVSTPDRDPRWRNITAVYCGKVDEKIRAVAGDDADDAIWFDITYDKPEGVLRFDGGDVKFECKLEIARDAFGRIDLNNTRIVGRGRLAFDHAKIICYLFEAIEEGLL
ncbi:MAG: NUDIX hydrolase [Clostridiales bacterium]|nr:NUDIX hydrolase [Clostridiales bacterium]